MSTQITIHCACGTEYRHQCPLGDWENPRMMDTPGNGAWYSVWLHSDWKYLTRKMTTEQRELAADRVAQYSLYLGSCEGDWHRPEPEGLRWWRERESSE